MYKFCITFDEIITMERKVIPMKKLILNKETFKGHGVAVSDHFIRLDRNSNVDRFFTLGQRMLFLNGFIHFIHLSYLITFGFFFSKKKK